MAYRERDNSETVEALLQKVWSLEEKLKRPSLLHRIRNVHERITFARVLGLPMCMMAILISLPICTIGAFITGIDGKWFLFVVISVGAVGSAGALYSLLRRLVELEPPPTWKK